MADMKLSERFYAMGDLAKEQEAGKQLLFDSVAQEMSSVSMTSEIDRWSVQPEPREWWAVRCAKNDIYGIYRKKPGMDNPEDLAIEYCAARNEQDHPHGPYTVVHVREVLKGSQGGDS